MDWKEFARWSKKTDIWKSNIEESNRYLRAPKGTTVLHWVHMLFKLKYEYFKHRPNKEEE